MENTNYKKFIPTSIALYFTYFIHGIGASILGLYKPQFAEHWGAEKLSDGTFDVSAVVLVIAALGLGRLISLPFSGPISDKFGRRLSGIIGVICYAMSPSMKIAYAFAIVGGIANSFLDTCVSPTCMEIYVNSPSVANLFTKFSMCISQFLLPFAIGAVAAANMSYRTIFIVAGIAIAIDGVLILFMPFPERGAKTAEKKKEKKKLQLSSGAIAAILIGFTSSSTFMLWLNCNKELGVSYGMSATAAGGIQSFYSLGTFAAILLTSVLIKKGLKETSVLVIYPAISVVTLLLVYFIQVPVMCYIAGFLLGYAAAGGVLQLAVSTTATFFPENKGTATSAVMIASSVANYTILSLAGYITKTAGVAAPRMILLLNAGVTVIGIILALIVKKSMNAGQK